MRKLNEKVRLIFLPFLVIAISFIIGYSFLNWLLFIETGILSLKEDIPNFWLPFILPWIPLLIWLRPRIKLLYFKNDNGAFALLFIASLFIALSTILVQKYIATATGKLTQLDNVRQFEQARPTKYYGLKNYFIDKSHAGIQQATTVSGKNNNNLNFAIYIALPVFASSADTAKGECSFWLGRKYSETVSNRLSSQEKNEKYKLFAERSQAEFDTTDFNDFTYLEKTGNTDDHDEFNNAIQQSDLVKYNHPVVFIPHYSAFANRNGGMLGWSFMAMGIGALAWFIILLFVKFDEVRLHQFRQGIRSTNNDSGEMLGLFIPKKGFFITPIIINLNILFYLAMIIAGLGLISFKAIDLLHWGANFRPATTNGQWWRLLTSIFLHGGLLHLVANMASLLFAGIFLEPLLGRTKYALIYLATGILASCASIWWHPATVSVGASGAIFGLYGVFLALLLLKVFPASFSKGFLISILVFVGYNLLMGFTGGIDNAAHIGGLVSGFIIGLLLTPILKKPNNPIADTL